MLQTGSGEASFTLSHPNQEDITFTADNHELALKWVTGLYLTNRNNHVHKNISDEKNLKTDENFQSPKEGV